MKKITLILIVFTCLQSITKAQINKGSVLLGGGVNFYNNKETASNPNQKENSIGFTPVIGGAIRQNLVAGIQLTYSHSKNKLTSAPAPDYENNLYGAEVFFRKYLLLGKNFYLFGQTSLYYRNSKYTYNYITYTTEQKDQSIGMGLYPGISYAVTKRFHLEVSLANLISFEYSNHKYINAGVITEDRHGESFNATASSLSNLTIGFRFFLMKK
jgi:hypothetical protein